MKDQTGTNTASSSPKRRLRVRIVHGDRWGPLFSIRKIVWFRLDIMVLGLGVLAASLVSVQGLSLGWNLAAVTILALGAVMPSTLRLTLSYSPTDPDSETPPSI